MAVPAEHCSQLQQLVHEAFAKHMYDSAVFFADMLHSLGGLQPVDMYTLAQAYYMNKQYRRALHMMKSADLIEQDPRCRYLAACCLAEMKDWEECLCVLGGWDDDEVMASLRQLTEGDEEAYNEASLIAAMLLMRGKAYNALENQQRAKSWYIAAVQADPLCYEAFKLLIDNHMLTSNEEYKLVESLRLPPQFQWLHSLYRAKCKKYDRQSTMQTILSTLEAPYIPEEPSSPTDASMQDSIATPPETPSKALGYQLANAGLDSAKGMKTRSMMAKSRDSPIANDMEHVRPNSPDAAVRNSGGYGLADNLTIMVCRADWLQHLGAHQDCFRLTSTILQKDPYALEAVPLYLTSALELRKKNDLFLQAHRLVEEYPDRPESWFAVGCYYMCTKQYELARRYYYKATTVCNNFAAAWIGFGHAFALQDESDQAMAAYRTAERLFSGLHLPLLGMGMEYHRMSNLPLAEQLFRQAHAICPADALVCNELGALAFRNNKFSEAEEWFAKAIEHMPEVAPPGFMMDAYESILVNLGHVYRKAQQFTRAIECYSQAISLAPGNASTYSALAFAHHLNGDLDEAILSYHKSLAMKPEDALAEELLTMALTEHCDAAFPNSP